MKEHQKLHRAQVSMTGQYFTEMLKHDIIHIENEKTIPADAKFIRVVPDEKRNCIIIEYESEEEEVLAEGAQLENRDMVMKHKTFFQDVQKLIPRSRP